MGQKQVVDVQGLEVSQSFEVYIKVVDDRAGRTENDISTDEY